MKLSYVELCGFRGFKEKVRIECGAGFTIVSGRNGVGKSTLCDAVEFALTGSIEKYKVEKAARESLDDYLWWRGEGVARKHFVTVSFAGEEGDGFTITRTRETGPDKTVLEIESALCKGALPENALRQLCKTSIIRDEWIAALSLDMSETERFDLVRSALGPTEGADYAVKAKKVLDATEAAHRRLDRAYATAHEQLTQCLAQLAEAKDAMARAGDVAAALDVARAAASVSSAMELSALLAAGRQALAQRRSRLSQSGEASAQGREILLLRRQFDAPAARSARDAAAVRLRTASAAKTASDDSLAAALRAFELEEQADAIAGSLAILVEHGERLGLHDEQCPLCAAVRTQDEFEAGLKLARARMEALSSNVASARARLAAARDRAAVAAREHAEAEAVVQTNQRDEAELVARERAHIELFERLSIDMKYATDPDGLEQDLASERDRLIELERALLTLEASQAVSQIAALEDRVAALRKDVEAAAAQLARGENAVTLAKSIDREIRRVSGEIIDERLAQISPLLNELYQRLRPHPEWRTIDYGIRGDVRRFLTLRVGEGLNPQFVFSSGQRRAAGLAFLLSVHLARAWTNWRTLVLDDPVQHIDDFRALHLAELLAALRAEGRQVVCAVEDPALADLLCRRLLSTDEEPGNRYDLGIDANGVAAVLSARDVPPTPPGVLRGGGLAAVS